MALQVAEHQPKPEAHSEKETFSASPRLKMHIAQGNFDANVLPNQNVPDTISQVSYQALEAQHDKHRAEDNLNQRATLDEQLQHDKKNMHNFRVHLKTLKRNKDHDPDPVVTDEEVYHYHHMIQWAGTEAARIGAILSDKSRLGTTGKIFHEKLGINIMSGKDGVKLSLFNHLTNQPGDFYKEFCNGDTNGKLAKKLTVEEMYAIKPFLQDVLGDWTDTAFNALVALRQTQEALNDASQQQALANSINNPLSVTDTPILDYYKTGLAMIPDEKKVAPSLPANQEEEKRPSSSPVNLEAARKDAALAQEEVFGRSEKHERSAEDVSQLIADVSGVLQQEKVDGQGKMKPTIAGMSATADQSHPTREGNVVFIPKDAGQLVVLGDIHGDLTTVKHVLEKEHVLQGLTSGQKVQVVFMGDLVDRGQRDAEVMETVLALKRLFPNNVTIMKADHETAGGITDHNFPEHLEVRYPDQGKKLNGEYVGLFDELPRMVVGANGTVFVHGGPPLTPYTLDQLARLSSDQVKQVFDQQITWADPATQEFIDEQRRRLEQRFTTLSKAASTEEDRQQAIAQFRVLESLPKGVTLNPGRSYFYTREFVKSFLDTIGATSMVRVHQISESVRAGSKSAGDILWTIHTTGHGSNESAYNEDELHPRYAIFDLGKPVTQINPQENIREVWRTNSSRETASLKESLRKFASFMTSHGSVYTYDQDGRTTRLKASTNELLNKQDITVFVKLSPDEEQEFLNAYRHELREDDAQNQKIYVIERKPDDSPAIIRDIDDITNSDNLYLAITQAGKIIKMVKASITPTIGYQVFDTRHYQDDSGEWQTERHLGNKVVDITYVK